MSLTPGITTKMPKGVEFGSGQARGPGGRPNPLREPEFAKSVAEAFAAGLSRKQMCELFEVKDPDTITRWRRDPRVKSLALKIIEDRVLQVTRKVDGVIAERLEHAEEMTIVELLAVRKEFLGGALRAQTEKADEDTIAEAQNWLEENPEAADKLAKLFSTKPPEKKRDNVVALPVETRKPPEVVAAERGTADLSPKE